MFNARDFLDDPIHGDKFLQGNFWNDRGGKQIDTAKPVLFCKTDYLADLTHAPRVLVTHNSDHGPERYTRPEGVQAWFAQNAKSSKYIPIPIGLERPGIAGSGNVQDFIDAADRPAVRDNLVYINFSDGTNPERPKVKDHFRDCRWASIQEKRIPFRDFLQQVRGHVCCVSPPGNGSDCHRTWEALYMGTIPICEDNYHNREFARILPILLYSDFREIRLEWLLAGLRDIRRKLEANVYTLRALRAQFWLDLINAYGAA